MTMKTKEMAAFYGTSCREWLRRWDAGDIVWSVEMGGLGPGYEQAIQVLAVELLRGLVDTSPLPGMWHEDPESFERDRAAIESLPAVRHLFDTEGFSGAQVGAAWNLAIVLYRRGPVEALTDPAIEERKIQVSKAWPGAGAAA